MPSPCLLLPLPSLPSLLPPSPGTGTEIEQIKKGYSENRPRSQLSHVASELQGVQRIMFDNIGAVLKRGEMIESEPCIACGHIFASAWSYDTMCVVCLCACVCACVYIAVHSGTV